MSIIGDKTEFMLLVVVKTVQKQAQQDQAIRGLAEGLREMLGSAVRCGHDLPLIEGTTNVMEEIGQASLEVASLIDEYTKHSFVGKMI
jgi:hypothetical protein